MKIVDAHWEERNFGVTTQELVIEESDAAEDIARGIGGLTAGYQVVKLPSSGIKDAHIVESKGFSFIEAIIHVDADKESWGREFPKYKILSESEKDEMLEHIATGAFVGNDRFSLDPFFPKDKVIDRSKNVVFDEIGRGAAIIGLLDDAGVVGFTIVRKTGEREYVNIFDGIYPPYRGRKLSGLLLGCVLAYIEDEGGGRLYSGVSSNNTASLRTHIKAGYNPTGVTYVYIRHIGDAK